MRKMERNINASVNSISMNVKKLEVGGGESNREIDFGFVFVYVSCVRAKLCARILLQLGSAKLFSAAAAPVGRRTSRDVPRDVPGRPPANRRSRSRRKKLDGPQL